MSSQKELFRPDELQTARFKGVDRTVVLISGRLRVAREILPELELDCALLEHVVDSHVIVKVTAKWKGGSSSGLGVSVKASEKEYLQRWMVCLAETRGRHRALAAAGVAPGLYGSEEVDLSEEENHHRPNGRAQSAPSSPPSLPTAGKPALAGRKALSDRMVRQFGSVDAAIKALQIISGHRSTSTLVDGDLPKLDVALKLIEQNANDIDATRGIVANYFKLPWFNEMNDAEFLIISNTMKGNPRADHTIGPDNPPF